jgi:hypothetical protein
MDIQTLISEARERQIAQTNAYRTEQEERAAKAALDLNRYFFAAFGEGLYAALDADTAADIDDPARITFTYQARDYSVRRIHGDGYIDWRLTRLDPRAADDERRRPTTSITVYRSEMDKNIDAFVLALYDLDQEPNVPWSVRAAVAEPAAPVVSEQGAALLEALRIFLQSEI